MNDGASAYAYDAAGQRVQVWTFTTAQDWVQRGADIPVTFSNGDVFGARAKANGQVDVYRNGALLGTRDVTGWPYYANGGYIGLWFINASNAVLDDFGGGTVAGGLSGGAILAAAPHKEQGMQLARFDTTSPRVVGDAPSALVRPLQQSGGEVTPTVITYTYDALYRLTNATYSTGDVFTYTYDAVGNRLTQTTLTNTTVYTYDIANRLVNVGGVNYTWDNNGNLTGDGASTYAYDAANRLKTLTQGANTYTFGYTGLGDRLQQTLNGNTTTYVLDLNAGLTQVLADGTNTYLYGLNRIGEQQPGGFVYHLPDALGSGMCQGFLDTDGGSLVSFARHAPESSKVLGALIPTCSGQRGGIGWPRLKRSGWAR